MTCISFDKKKGIEPDTDCTLCIHPSYKGVNQQAESSNHNSTCSKDGKGIFRINFSFYPPACRSVDIIYLWVSGEAKGIKLGR